SAVNYILDLQSKGLMIDAHAVAEVLQVLFEARRRVSSDIDLIDFFLDKESLNSPNWTSSQFKKFNIDGPLLRSDLEDDFNSLLTRAEEEIEAVLNVECYDAWVVGQLGLASLLTAVRGVFNRFQLENSLQFVAPLTRIDEIHADALAFVY